MAKSISYTQAEQEYNNLHWYLSNVGILVDSRLNDYALMSGNLKLPPEVEIQLLRKVERFVSLGMWLDYLKTDKAKFRT